MRAGPRVALLLAAALVLAACSVTRFAYNNATVAAAWVLDDWFDLNDPQRDWLRERVARQLAWHRASELPEYQKFLQDTAGRVAAGLTPGDARWVYQSARGYYRRAIERLLPDIAEFLLQVDAEQASHLERRFADDNAKAVKRSVAGTPAERREKRAERFVEQIEDWTGRLSAAQRELVKSRVRALPDLTDDWMADRRHRQTETLALVRAKASRERMTAGLRRLLLETDAWRRPEYIARLHERDEQLFAMVGALDATLTAPQRERLMQRVRGFAGDVAYLMASGERP